jgi:hypothetical protein
VLGEDLAVNRWANYDHDATVKVSYTFASAMVPGRDIRVELYIDSVPGAIAGSATMFDSFTLMGATPALPPYSQVDFSTGVPALSNYSASGYYIKAYVESLPTPFNANMDVIASVDDDGVGQNTDRGNYTQAFGLYDIFTPFDNDLVDGSPNGVGFPQPIAWNKRTNFSVTFS